MTAPALVQKLWNYCNILRDDGLSFILRRGYRRQDSDYVEQLTCLLFLKMAEVKRCLNGIDEFETLATANLTRATRLRQSILQQAFTGELLTADNADITDEKRKTTTDIITKK